MPDSVTPQDFPPASSIRPNPDYVPAYISAPSTWTYSTDQSNGISRASYNGEVIVNGQSVSGTGWANVLDYGAGSGGDDAAAIRAAIASGKKTVLIPPGTYTMKSTVATYGSATNPSCFELRGLTDVVIIAYGATLLVDNSIASPAVTTCSITSNSKHCMFLGGTLIGNHATGENVGINLCSVTDITLKDVKFTGYFVAAITGVYVFDSLFDNLHAYNTATPLDMAHLENLMVSRCHLEANPASATGVNIHYDVPTLGDNNTTRENGSARSLLTGCTNNLRFLDCLIEGFGNGIAVDCVDGLLVSRSVVRNGLVASSANASAGLLIYIGTAAAGAGLPTTNITIDDCDIYGNGVTAGGGVGGGIYLGASSGSVTNINVLDSRIYNNTASGITSATPTSIAGLFVTGCDFRARGGSAVQTAAFVPGLRDLLTASGTATGADLGNQGVVTVGADYLMVEGNSQNGVADADGKLAVLRLTSNQNAGGVGGGIEFGGRRNASGTGPVASGYYAALKGSLVDGSNNTLGTLDVYVRNINTDTSLTRVASFASAGLNACVIGASTAAAGTFTQANFNTTAGPNIRAGTGAATGTQPAGSLWLRTDGSAGARLYVSQGGGTWAAVSGV